MNYESIILELMTRIKILETRCDEMERKLEAFEEENETSFNEHDNESFSEEFSEQNTNQRKKMTKEMIKACYEYGVTLYRGQNTDFNQEIDRLSDKMNINRNSAVMYVYAVKSMLNGDVYKRAINLTATEMYFQYIFRDFGKNALKKAIGSARAHISYRRSLGQVVDGLEELCNRYEKNQ